MKKLVLVLAIAILCLTCLSCGEPVVEYVYVDSYREIDVSKLTNENFTLSRSHSYTKITDKDGRTVTIYEPTVETITYRLYSSNKYGKINYDTPFLDYTHALLSIEFVSIREYNDFALVVYNVTFRYNLIYNRETKEFEDIDGEVNQVTMSNHADCFFKDKDVVMFDILLYKN